MALKHYALHGPSMTDILTGTEHSSIRKFIFGAFVLYANINQVTNEIYVSISDIWHVI